MLDLKQQQLSIALTEPVLFLRSSDPSGRLQPDPNDPPTLVRGILTLNVAKPIGISSIDVELTGTLTVSYPEGVPPRNLYITEKHKVYSSTASVFRAGQLPHGKRPASVGPGLSAANFSVSAHTATALFHPPSVRRGYSEDQNGVGDPPGLDPTPPYASVAWSPSQSERRAFARRGSPTRVLEELRRPLSHALERQGFRGAISPSSPHPHSFSFQHPDAIAAFTAAVFGNEPVRRGNDNTISVISDLPGLSSTPPYTPVAQSPPPIESGVSRTFQEHRRPLNDRLERQGHRSGVSCRSSRRPQSFSSLPLPESASIGLNQPLLPEDIHTAHTSNGSVHSAIRELPHIHPHRDPSPGSPSRSFSPENRSGPGTRGSSRESSVAPAGRSRWRLSLDAVLDAVLDVTSRAPARSQGIAGSEESERGRPRVRGSAEGQSRERVQGGGVAGTESNNHLAAKARRPSCPTDHREHYFLGLGRVLGLERDHEKKESDARPKAQDQGEGWREFKPGTYSYPISFLLPPNLPPTFSVPRGSLRYTIKAVAHRPGAFTPKLSCHVPLLIVAAPAIGAGEGLAPGDPGPLFFQRQWEGKLAYSFGLSSRLFRIGSEHHLEASASGGVPTSVDPIVDAEMEARAAYGTAVLDLTLLPIEKVKLWRLSVFVDEHVKYLDGRRKVCRDEDDRRVLLLEVRDVACPKEVASGLVAGESEEEEKLTYKNKHRNKHDSTPIPVPIPIPLLPTPLSPDRSPLLRYVSPSVDSSTLVGPGPYTLSIPLGLPECNGRAGGGKLHFSVRHKSSLVRVEHALRVVMRVERVGDSGDSNDRHHDEAGDKKRCFDITIQTPIAILSCRCVPENQTLPRYSPTTEDDSANHAACPCQPATERQGQGQGQGEAVSGPSSTRESEDGHASHGPTDDDQQPQPCAAHPARASPLVIPTPLHPPSSPASYPHPSPPPVTNRTENHSHGWHRHSRSSSHHAGVAANAAASVTGERTATTPHSSQPPSPPPPPPPPPSAPVLLPASEPVLAQYERLVSGLESEAGEAPPSYESIALSHHSRI